MKILFIDLYAVLGGVTMQLLNRFRSLSPSIECHFSFLYDYGATKLFENYKHVYILNGRDSLAKLVEKYNYDIISIIDANIVYKWLSSIQYNGFIINEVHTTYPSNLNNLKKLKENPKMDLIVTPSDYMKNIIENEYGFKGRIPVEVIPNCLDFSKFKYKASKKVEKTCKILWVGRLDSHKRYEDFLRICENLEHKYKGYNFEYIIVGGCNASELVIDNLLKKSIEYGILDKLTWYSAIDYFDMYKIYSMVKDSGGIYVSTSSNESFGMTVLEAMSIGIPVVVPNVGALSEIICKNEHINSLYEPENLSDACQLIIKQLNRNIEYNLSNYTLEKNLENFKEIINTYYRNKQKR